MTQIISMQCQSKVISSYHSEELLLFGAQFICIWVFTMPMLHHIHAFQLGQGNSYSAQLKHKTMLTRKRMKNNTVSS